uniref:Uncharacterized protein n=1 Tax=Panagrolaimus sp. ES5 TaxID=591445 RepID=A0AC34GCP3_9BILA
MCRTGDCMPKEVKCDGHLNCSDGSDEIGCNKINTKIPQNFPTTTTSTATDTIENQSCIFWIYGCMILALLL